MAQTKLTKISQPELDLLQMCSAELEAACPGVKHAWSSKEVSVCGGGFLFCAIEKEAAAAVMNSAPAPKDEPDNIHSEILEGGEDFTLECVVFKYIKNFSAVYMAKVSLISGDNYVFLGTCTENTIPELTHQVKQLLTGEGRLENSEEEDFAVLDWAENNKNSRPSKTISHLPFNDYDMAAVTNMVRDAKADILKSDFDITAKSRGVVTVLTENWRDNDDSIVVFEIHKIGKKRLLGHKVSWVVRIFTIANRGAERVEFGCAIGDMQVLAVSQAQKNFTEHNADIADFDTACSMATGI